MLCRLEPSSWQQLGTGKEGEGAVEEEQEEEEDQEEEQEQEQEQEEEEGGVAMAAEVGPLDRRMPGSTWGYDCSLRCTRNLCNGDTCPRKCTEPSLESPQVYTCRLRVR